MDIQENAIIAVIFTAIGSLATKFFEYSRQKLKDSHDADLKTNEQIVAGYALTISKLDTRITILEQEIQTAREELKTAREEHNTCLKVQGELKADLAALKTQLSFQHSHHPEPPHQHHPNEEADAK